MQLLVELTRPRGENHYTFPSIQFFFSFFSVLVGYNTIMKSNFWFNFCLIKFSIWFDFAFDLIEQTALKLLWNCSEAETALKLLWNCSEMLWNCSETALKNCSKTALKKCSETALKNCPETALKLLWNCSETALKLLWNCSETETALKFLNVFDFAFDWIKFTISFDLI